MNLPDAAAQALVAFTDCRNWETRARLLMRWGERLTALSADQCRDEHLVQGCETRVWLLAEAQDGCWQFYAASEARLLRGLLSLLLARVNGLTHAELAQVDLLDWFNQLGLSRQLSPSRSNGLNAVLQRMRSLTQA
jgi:cysteine desulfuration protein SufE